MKIFALYVVLQLLHLTPGKFWPFLVPLSLQMVRMWWVQIGIKYSGQPTSSMPVVSYERDDRDKRQLVTSISGIVGDMS